MVKKFFVVKEHVYHTVHVVASIRASAYVIMYIQFVQLVFYFNAHPRMAVLYATLEKCAQEMAHFLLLFFFLFMFLAMMAYFQFGDHVPQYSTFAQSIESHVMMIFGDFLTVEEAANRLSPTQYFLYWVYAGTFLLVTFFILLNFFLAIVVDAFVAVKEDISEKKFGNSFSSDLTDMLTNFYYYRINQKTRSWPRPKVVAKWLERRGGVKRSQKATGVAKVILDTIICEGLENFCTEKLSAAELQNEFPSFSEDSLVTYITLYANKMTDDAELVTAEKPEEPEEVVEGNNEPRAVLFAEVAAKCVEEAAMELSNKPETPLHLLASRMCNKMTESFHEEELARKKPT